MFHRLRCLPCFLIIQPDWITLHTHTCGGSLASSWVLSSVSISEGLSRETHFTGCSRSQPSAAVTRSRTRALQDLIRLMEYKTDLLWSCASACHMRDCMDVCLHLSSYRETPISFACVRVWMKGSSRVSGVCTKCTVGSCWIRYANKGNVSKQKQTKSHMFQRSKLLKFWFE